MAFLPDGMADEIADADVFTRGERARDGEYTFLHIKTSYEKTRRGPALIIEHEVVEAKKIVADVEPNAVGSRVSYFMPDYGDAAVMLKPNMKNYVCGLAGHDPKTVSKEVVKELTKRVGGPDQLGRGMLIKGLTFHTEKRNDGEDFMGFNWYPVPGENTPTSAGVLKRRAELDARGAGSRSESSSASNGNGSNGNGASTAPALPGAGSSADGPPALPGAAPVDPIEALKAQGWKEHPADKSYMWRGKEYKKKEELVAGLGK